MGYKHQKAGQVLTKAQNIDIEAAIERMKYFENLFYYWTLENIKSPNIVIMYLFDIQF